MVATDSNLQKLKVYATLTNSLDKYVYLREDEKGRYIEYAFIEGAPHDNRCLSWYVKPHPLYDKNHNGTPIVWANVGEIYELWEFACGRQNKEGTERCCAGHPMEKCSFITAGARAGEKWRDWSYEEPVKCACWDLDEIHNIDNVSIPIDVAVKLFDEILKIK